MEFTAVKEADEGLLFTVHNKLLVPEKIKLKSNECVVALEAQDAQESSGGNNISMHCARFAGLSINAVTSCPFWLSHEF